jgi:preprotein translocase SecE subunit
MGPNKYVHLIFAIGCLLATYLLAQIGTWVWGYFGKPKELVVNGAALLVALVATIAAYRSEGLFNAALDTTKELEKVTWPTRKETSAATVVVLVTVSVAAVILAAFDLVWGRLANLVMH